MCCWTVSASECVIRTKPYHHFFACLHSGRFDLWSFSLRAWVTGIIFAVVFSLLVYSIVRFRRRTDDDGREPPQVYGSNQLELAWTVIPMLIVVVLFLATARVIDEVQEASRPPGAIEVVVVGHQFWWEFRYPGLGGHR